PSYVINPRSHSPNTLRQFAVAGLSPEEDVPSKIYRHFPHQPLPDNYTTARDRRGRSRRDRMKSATSGSEADVDTDVDDGRWSRAEQQLVKSYSHRMKHLNTMTAIMHRCLYDGDIERAKRAFGMLVRTKEVDIRLNNMWAVGSEILMRDGEEKRHQSKGKDVLHDDHDEQATEGASSKPPPRWGSAENVETVKRYLEILIQQHPHDPHRPRLTSAVDFWPALFSIEIYSIDAEFKRALHRLDEQLDSTQDAESDTPLSYAGSDDFEMQSLRRDERRKSTKWASKDEIRQDTREAAQQIATRMDQIMENAPYDRHLEILRLRGMVSLFIGDLHLPTRIVEKQGIEDKLQGLEYELDKARDFFRRILERKGRLEPWLMKFL
ncbi:uncharacterized protein BCR38DRAFT_321086, partial [Pseudomassariella vexata]